MDGSFRRFPNGVARILALTLIVSLAWPMAPARGAAHVPADDPSYFVLRRLNSPERQAAIEAARREDEAAREAFARREALREEALPEPALPLLAVPNVPALTPAPARQQAASNRPAPDAPRSVSELLFNGITGFAGLPGLGTSADLAGPELYDIAELVPTPSRKLQPRHGRSGQVDLDDPQRLFLERGLSFGAGRANQLGEAAFLSLAGKGRARLNFMVDLDGRVNGEGDIFYPFYDSPHTTLFTQIGARTMSGMSGSGENGRGADRWIGNLGLGQRWFPRAFPDGETIDSGDLMFGYNVFFDNDFTRSHQRGGLGVEVQFDWLRLASNVYFPLSSWKDSYDYDGYYVEERAAAGWDVRARGYLPWHRSLALTGSFTQWYGDRVAMFSSDDLEKDPRVWSYGLEYTPVPLVSASINQRTTERGRHSTELGLRLTYRFDMPLQTQLSRDKVQALRTVGGDRHDFVDRENRIILEYRAKDRFNVEYLGTAGENVFRFRLVHAFDDYVAGKMIMVTAGNGVTLAEAPAPNPTLFARAARFVDNLISVSRAYAQERIKSYVSDANGEFLVRLDSVTVVPASVTIQVGGSTHQFQLREATLTASLSASPPMVYVSGSTLLTFQGTGAHAGLPVDWQIASGPGTLSNQDPTTDGSGKSTAVFSADVTAGPVTIMATVDGREYLLTVNVQAVVVTLSAAQIVIPNSGTTVLTLDAMAPNGSKTVSWAVESGDGTLSNQVTTTNGDGQATATLTAPATGNGDITVKATINGTDYRVTVNYGSPTVTLTASAGTMNNGESVTLTLDAQAANAMKPVNWTVVSGPADLVNPQTTTNGNGKSTATLTAKAAGSGVVTVRATINGTNYEVNVTVQASGGAGTLTAASEFVGNWGEVDITFQTSPEHAGATLEWEVVSGPLEWRSRPMSVGSNGSAKAIARGKQSGNGPAVVKVTMTLANSTTEVYTVQVIVGPRPAITIPVASVVNGGSVIMTLDAKSWNASQAVTWQLVSGEATISEEQTTADGNGKATARLTIHGSASGTVTARATINGYEADLTVTIIQDDGSLVAYIQEYINGAEASFTFTSSGAVSLQQVSWTIVSGPGTIVSGATMTNALGKATARVKMDDTALGAVTVQATANGKDYQATVFIIEPTLTASSPTVYNNGSLNLTLQGGNPLANKYLNWEVIPALLGTLPTKDVRADTSGRASAVFSAASAGSGPVTITASVQGGGPSYSVTVNLLSRPARLTASATSVGNGGTVQLTYESTDANAGLPVTWQINGPGALSGQQSQVDSTGAATATMTANGSGSGAIIVTATVGGQSHTATIDLGETLFFIEHSLDRDNFATEGFKATATMTAKGTVNGSPIVLSNVTWEVLSSRITESWWALRTPGAMNGLTWGATPLTLTSIPRTRENMTGNGGTAPTGATAQLTDIVGSRTVRVKASAVINSQAYEAIATFTFGPGPLSVFRGTPSGHRTWAQAVSYCGGTGNTATPGYNPTTRLPSVAQLQAISAPGRGGRYGAYYATNWPIDCYWSGEVTEHLSRDGVFLVGPGDGGYSGINIIQYSEQGTICIQ